MICFREEIEGQINLSQTVCLSVCSSAYAKPLVYLSIRNAFGAAVKLCNGFCYDLDLLYM